MTRRRIAQASASGGVQSIKPLVTAAWSSNILSLVDGSDEMEDVHALQILLQSIKTLAEKGLGQSK